MTEQHFLKVIYREELFPVPSRGGCARHATASLCFLCVLTAFVGKIKMPLQRLRIRTAAIFVSVVVLSVCAVSSGETLSSEVDGVEIAASASNSTFSDVDERFSLSGKFARLFSRRLLVRAA